MTAKAAIPALVCMAGLLVCSWKLYRVKPLKQPNYTIEITVHGPDGQTIPIVSRRPDD